MHGSGIPLFPLDIGWCITTLIHMRADLLFNVAPSSGTPIYRQIVEQVRARVAGGSLPAGAMLPSVRQVAAAVQVNPMTVSKAYSMLEAEGLLVRRRGQGMQVAKRAGGGTVRQRQEQLEPLVEQIASKARQLSLTRRQVRQITDAMLKELPDE